MEANKKYLKAGTKSCTEWNITVRDKYRNIHQDLWPLSENRTVSAKIGQSHFLAKIGQSSENRTV